MKKNLSFVMAVGWVFSLSLAGLAEAQTVEIGTWAGFRAAAVSFTFDDGPQSDVGVALPLFEKYGYKATFNIVTNWASGNINGMLTWSGVQELAAAGHEIASHSDSHPNGGAMPASEITSSKGTISQKIQQPYGCVTLAYPNCNTPGDAQVLQNYVVGRICNASWSGGSDIMGKNGPSNWAAVPAMMTGNEGTSDFKGNMQKAVQQGGWVAFLTHGFTTGTNGYANYSPTDASAMEEGLQYAKQNDKDIWVAPMGFVAMYIKERNASTATASTSGSSITVKLTHNIADNISKYNYPLSLRIKNDNNWTTASGTQGGKAIATSIKDGYIYFDAVPNGGDVVISSGGSTNPSSSASTQPGSSAAQPVSSSSGSGVGFLIEMEDYMPGGEGLGYSDLNGENGGTGYRSDDAGIVPAGEGFAIGYTMAGEWFAYSLDVPCEGPYSIVARAATGNANTTRFSVSVENVAGEVAVDVPSTGDWDTYTEVEGDGTLNLKSGKNVVKVNVDQSYVNVDWLKMVPGNVQCPGNVSPQSSASNDATNSASPNPQNPGANNPSGGEDSEAIYTPGDIHWSAFSGNVYCQVFDMNGHLLKSGTVPAQGSVQALWNVASKGLSKGMFVLRYGNGLSTRSVQVRK